MGLFNEPIKADRSGLRTSPISEVPEMDGHDLELILDKTWKHSPLLSRNFSVKTYTRLIDDVLNIVEETWGGYHTDEFTRTPISSEAGGFRVETRGTRGFYAVAEYLPPDDKAGRKKAQIKLTIPLNPRVEDLTDHRTAPLRVLVESLTPKGYKSASVTPYKTQPHLPA